MSTNVISLLLSKDDLSTALQNWPSLSQFSDVLIEQYPLNLIGCHRIHLTKFNITLDLWFGDACQSLENIHIYEDGLFDAWFLDGFSPNKNPELWQQPLFDLVVKSAKQDATIATFTAASFVRKGLQQAGVVIKKRKGFGKKREMITGIIPTNDTRVSLKQFIRNPANQTSKDVAIIGGGLSAALLTFSLVKRGFDVTVYCQAGQLAKGASGNKQGALYPLLNGQHNELSQFFANAYLYAINTIQSLNKTNSFDHDLSGLLQLYYDATSSAKLDKILNAQLPDELVKKQDEAKTNIIAGLAIDLPSIFYPQGGWINPAQMIKALFEKSQSIGNVTVKLSTNIERFTENNECWQLHSKNDVYNHSLVILASAMQTLDFKECEAIPLSAARGQVTYIESDPKSALSQLNVPLCHEGYLTPQRDQIHCMGATFNRHDLNGEFRMIDQHLNKAKLNKCVANKKWVEDIDCEHNAANVGVRCTTRDHFPYTGQLADYQKTKLKYQAASKHFPDEAAPFHKNMFILTGLGSRGLCSGPLLAETLVSQIEHEPLPLSASILNSLQTNRQWITYLLKNKPLAF